MLTMAACAQMPVLQCITHHGAAAQQSPPPHQEKHLRSMHKKERGDLESTSSTHSVVKRVFDRLSSYCRLLNSSNCPRILSLKEQMEKEQRAALARYDDTARAHKAVLALLHYEELHFAATLRKELEKREAVRHHIACRQISQMKFMHSSHAVSAVGSNIPMHVLVHHK